MPDHTTEFVHGTADTGKSRSQKKRESTSLQRMGEALAALPPPALASLALPPELLGAVHDLKTMKKHEARRRQNQLVGRLMRELDAEEERRITVFLQNKGELHELKTRAFHQAEGWRDALLDPDSREKTLAEISRAFPFAEAGKIRHLAACAQAERALGKKTKSLRELFRYIKGLEEQK